MSNNSGCKVPMTGKERVLAALSGQETDRTPWVPYAGVQTGNLLGIDAESYLKSADNIVAGITKAAGMYHADGIPVVFDIQMEAEALGCKVKWAEKNPPSVYTHILDEVALEDLKKPTEKDGRYPIVLEAAERVVKELGDKLAIYGLICGPFTLALHLQGTKIFSDMIRSKDKVEALMAFTTSVGKDLAKMYIDRGIDVIAVVDPMVSQISPRHFKQYITPFMTEINEYIKSLGVKVVTFVCGDVSKNFELLCQTNTDGIAFDENVDLANAKEIAVRNNISFGGNLPLTSVMLFGSPMDCVMEAQKQLDIAAGPGYILAPGCDLAYDTPVENLVAIGDFISGNFSSIDSFMTESSVEVDEGEELEEVEIVPGKAFVEIVTLDSEGCPPCQYMIEAIKAIEADYGDKLRWRETLIKAKAGIRRVGELGVKNLPAMLINNEVVFDNIIPSEEELREAIDKRL
ncbi:MAG: uroporphyrinogen decarboxylase family protein [Anaerovoracaceae bacterium]|jgi:MtaA/CmuA family methyltransferase